MALPGRRSHVSHRKGPLPQLHSCLDCSVFFDRNIFMWWLLLTGWRDFRACLSSLHKLVGSICCSLEMDTKPHTKDSVSSIIVTLSFSNMSFWGCPHLLCVSTMVPEVPQGRGTGIISKSISYLVCSYKFLVVHSDGKPWLLLGLTFCWRLWFRRVLLVCLLQKAPCQLSGSSHQAGDLERLFFMTDWWMSLIWEHCHSSGTIFLLGVS